MSGNTSYGAQTPQICLALRAATLLFGIFDLQGKYLIFLAAEGGEKNFGTLDQNQPPPKAAENFWGLGPPYGGGWGVFRNGHLTRSDVPRMDI